jgi:hypothetical protein
MKNSKRIAAVALGAAMMITTAPSYGQADTLHVYGVGAETCKKVARLAKNKADLEVYEFFGRHDDRLHIDERSVPGFS